MVYELAKQDERIVFIGSDLGAGVLEDFKREMPDRFFMEGIGEANMVGMAAGMALSGKIVYCHTIATFLTRRAFEQVAIDVGLHQANVRLIGAGGGAVYAPLGPTHLATDDIALMRTIPGMTILAPCDAPEMEALMPQTVNHAGPMYIRLGRGGDPIVEDNHVRDIGQVGYANYGNSGVTFISTGTATQIATEAAKEIGGTVLHVPTVKPFPEAQVLAFTTMDHIVTVEDHSVIGGLGSAVAEIMAGMPLKQFTRIGYPDVFPHGHGTQDEMRARYGITAEAIVSHVRGVNENSNFGVRVGGGGVFNGVS
jgi:transketolase